MKPDGPEILDKTHVALRMMLAQEQITEDVYCKNIVVLAARWIAIGQTEDANAMVCELPPKYVALTLPKQMEEDEDFRKVALKVSMALSSMPLDIDDDDVELAVMLLERPIARA